MVFWGKSKLREESCEAVTNCSLDAYVCRGVYHITGALLPAHGLAGSIAEDI